MPNILVLANQTVGGAALLDAVKRHHEEGDAHFFLVVPETRPRHGSVIYTDAVRDGAQVRVDLSLGFMREEGIDGTGEVGDADPYNAAMDAIHAHRIDHIIVSTLPANYSGWLRRDLIDRLKETTGLPVEHVVVDLANEGLPFKVTLVVANQTAAGPQLTARLKELAGEEPRRLIVTVPQNSGDGRDVAAARERLRTLLDSLTEEGIVAAGFIGDPDPFIATQNALQFFHISEVVISTLPEYRSKWVRSKLVERVQRITNRPVEHVESEPGPGGAAETASDPESAPVEA